MAITSSRRTAILSGVALALSCLPLPSLASENAKDFPSKSITIIAHTGAGSSTDIFARQLARAAEPVFGQPVVVVNKPGGSGATQMAMIKSSTPDGYTIGVNTASHVTSMLTTLKGIYSIPDFSWLMLNQLDPYIIVVKADSPYKTLNDLVSHFTKDKNGKTARVGGFGTVGAAHNIAFNIFGQKSGMPFTWVNYNGGPQAITALLGGEIDAVNTNVAPALQFYKAGRVRILGIMSSERSPSLPDVPTYAEGGYPVDTSWNQIRGLYGPKNIPMDIQKKLAAGFFKAMESEEFKKYMESSALIAGTLGPTEYPAFINKMNGVADEWLKRLGVVK